MKSTVCVAITEADVKGVAIDGTTVVLHLVEGSSIVLTCAVVTLIQDKRYEREAIVNSAARFPEGTRIFGTASNDPVGGWDIPPPLARDRRDLFCAWCGNRCADGRDANSLDDGLIVCEECMPDQGEVCVICGKPYENDVDGGRCTNCGHAIAANEKAPTDWRERFVKYRNDPLWWTRESEGGRKT